MTVELPTHILAVGAGKDAWMRGVIVKCTGCRCEDRVENLNQGLYCEECASDSELRALQRLERSREERGLWIERI